GTELRPGRHQAGLFRVGEPEIPGPSQAPIANCQRQSEAACSRSRQGDYREGAGSARYEVSGAKHCFDVVSGRLVRTKSLAGTGTTEPAAAQVQSHFIEGVHPGMGLASGSGPPYGIQRNAVRLLGASTEPSSP